LAIPVHFIVEDSKIVKNIAKIRLEIQIVNENHDNQNFQRKSFWYVISNVGLFIWNILRTFGILTNLVEWICD
jgi:hypothetical protein